jgi:FSR family fosmidomycin resistance protein-like MFS transporter
MHGNPDAIGIAIDVSESPPNDDAPKSKFQIGRVLTVMAGHATHDTYTAFLPPLLPVFITNFALSKVEAGLLSFCLSSPSVLQPFIGHTAERISLKTFVILGPAVVAVMMSALGIAPSYWVVALLLLFAGLGSAGFHSTAPVMMGKLSGRELGQGMGFWMVGGELGRTLGPIAIVTALRFLTLRGTPWLMLVGLLSSVILYFRLRDVPEDRDGTRGGLEWGAAFRSLKPIGLPLAGIALARAFFLPAITTYLPTFLTEAGVELWSAGLSLSLLEIAGVLGAMLGGLLSDRLGRRRVLAAAMIGAPLFMFLFLRLEGGSRTLILPFLGFTGLSLEPVMMALVQENVPEHRALANGVYLACSFLFRSCADVTLGAIGDVYGLQRAFQLSAMMMLAGTFLIPALPKGNRPSGSG